MKHLFCLFLVVAWLLFPVVAQADEIGEASSIAQGEVGSLGEWTILFVLTQLKYDYDLNRNVRGRWYGWANYTERTRELAEWIWSQGGYLYPRCKFTISEQDRLLFVSYGWLEPNHEPDYTFALRPDFKAHGVQCEWDDWAERVFYPASNLENDLVQ